MDLITEVARRRAAGLEVDEIAVERNHPELMPELRDRLLRLRAMEAAAEEADLRSTGAAEGEWERDFCEEQRLLESALAGYRVLHRLEGGGQGVIYRGVQVAPNRPVAIKVLLEGPLASPRQRRRFEREVELVSRLRHPNIVTLYDSGVVRGRPYYTMEFVDGVPIDDYLLLHRLPVKECVRLFVRVCRAVAYAHQRGIIHRDLKPANILIDLDGEPHILDFGLAKAVEGGQPVDETVSVFGRLMGTMPYLSPEQAGADDGEIDVRSDIYSLGVVLYRLLSGVFPYPIDGSSADVCAHIIHRPPRSLRKVLRGASPEERCCIGAVSDDLERIALKALAKEKSRRYQSAAALADDLERYLRGEAVEAKSDQGWYQVAKAIRRYRLQLGFSLLLLAVVAAASAVALVQWSENRAQRRATRAVAEATQDGLETITEIIDAVGGIAGGAPLRGQLIEDAEERYEQLLTLAESNPQDESLGPLRGRIHERLGDLANRRGDRAEAAKHYQAYLGIARTLGEAADAGFEARLDYLRAQGKMARVAEDGMSAYEHAVGFGEELVGRFPERVEARKRLAEIRLESAEFLFTTGYYEASARQADAVHKTIERLLGEAGEDDTLQDSLAEAHEWLGQSRIQLGNAPAGVESLELALDLRQRLFERQPQDVWVRHRLMLANLRLATAYRDGGRADAAEPLFHEAIEVGEGLVVADPTVVEWPRDLLSARLRLAKMLLREARLDEAATHCDASVRLAQDVDARVPLDPESRRMLGFAYTLRGELAFHRRRFSEASQYFADARGLREQLAVEQPGNEAITGELASAYDWLSRSAAKLGQVEQALESSQRAYDVWQSLAEADPATVWYATGVISSMINLSMCHLTVDTPDHDAEAARLLEDADAQLSDLEREGKVSGWEAKHDAWRKAIDRNRKILAKRSAEQRREPAHAP